MAAGIVGCLGILVSWAIGTEIMGMDLWGVIHGIGASNIAGMTALLTTLQLERTSWVRAHILKGSLQTWALFLSLYFGILLSLYPVLRETKGFVWMILPLIMTTGFTILAFGPIQDRKVANAQRRQRLRVGTTR